MIVFFFPQSSLIPDFLTCIFISNVVTMNFLFGCANAETFKRKKQIAEDTYQYDLLKPADGSSGVLPMCFELSKEVFRVDNRLCCKFVLHIENALL